MKQTVAVDLDAVLAQYEKWEGVETIGDPVEGAQEFTETLAKQGWRVLVYTTRCSVDVNEGHTEEELKKIVQAWLDTHQFWYDEIYSGRGKPIATAYVDDRSVICRPQENPKAFEAAVDYIKKVLVKEPETTPE